MKKYRHLFFDLDHTLWDYERNAQESLSELYEEYALMDFGVPSSGAFFRAFTEVNHLLWEHYNVGKIDKEMLRNGRFLKVFERLGIKGVEVPVDLEDNFIARTSAKPHLFPYSKEILQYLHSKYDLHVITNGFNESQSLKMNASGITRFFKLVVTSETTGHMKPDKRIFEYAMHTLATSAKDCLMIGDNPVTDIQGAQNAFIDQVYFNPNGSESDPGATYTIRELRELENML